MKGMGAGRDLLITEGLLKILEFFVDLCLPKDWPLTDQILHNLLKKKNFLR